MYTLPTTITSSHDSIDFILNHDIKQGNWQLFDRDIQDIQSAISCITDTGITIVSLHSPFEEGWTAIRIETYLYNKNYIDSILYAAEQIGIAFNSVLPLVFHTSMYREELNSIKDIASAINPVLLQCPHVKIVLENTGCDFPLDAKLDKIPFMVPQVVQMFNQYLVDVSVGACLDICHAEIVKRTMQLLIDNDVIVGDTAPSVEDYAKAFGEDCLLVHLSNTRGFGIKKPGHGAGFNINFAHEVDLLRHYLELCQTYLKNARVVLEISEIDYSNRIEALHTLEVLKHLGGQDG